MHRQNEPDDMPMAADSSQETWSMHSTFPSEGRIQSRGISALFQHHAIILYDRKV
jgi:hypothetical protein